MSIKHAILGLLSWKPSTGYDLKKIFEDSSAMYWSGNNNQIYKSLVQLLDEGLVTSELLHQESLPSKKVYTITPDGIEELREWVLSSPEPPEFRKTFLIKLAWSDRLGNDELEGILSAYENEVRLQLMLQQEKNRRGIDSPRRTSREKYLWDAISENIAASYRNELEWVQKVRNGLHGKGLPGEENIMNCRVVEARGKRYVECISAEVPLGSERDALDLIAECGGNDTDLLMIHEDSLSEEFFRLQTGIAGHMLQKFANYRIKAAAVVPEEQINKGRFRELALESNKGNHFGVFSTREEAESWLLGL